MAALSGGGRQARTARTLRSWTRQTDDLEGEIEIFRKDEETAQQFLFAYLGVRDITAKRPDVLAAVNRNPMFWLTTHHAMFV